MHYARQFLFMILILNSTQTVQASESARDRLDQFVKTVMTFQARFTQTVMDAQGKVQEQAQGLFVLQRPGRFRWDYQQPYPQYIIADGQRIWFYDVDLEQVTVKSQLEALADSPASLLSGETLPEQQYIVTDLPSKDHLLWVELTPRDSNSSFKSIRIAFDDHSLKQMLMTDNFDQQTRLEFSQVVENPKVDRAVFVFTPPKGVDVVGDVP